MWMLEAERTGSLPSMPVSLIIVRAVKTLGTGTWTPELGLGGQFGVGRRWGLRLREGRARMGSGCGPVSRPGSLVPGERPRDR